ncbi:MAG: hypothetical protein AB9819_02860 [Methanomassiliicoccales archaeon]
MSPLKDKDSPLALIIGMVLITAVVLGVMAFVPLEPFSSEKDWSYQGTAPLESVRLSLDADVCDVVVAFDDLPEGWVEVSMSAEGRSGYIAGEPGINFTVASSLNGANLTVSIVLDMETGPTVTYGESDIVVTIDRFVLTFLEIEVDVGDVAITVPENATLTGAAVHTDVGGLQVRLEEGAKVGDLDLRSDVGSVSVDCANAIFDDDALISAETGTGSIYLDVEQTSAPEGNFTFDCFAAVGSVHLTLMIQGDVAAEITSQANVGDIETELSRFSGMDVHLVSENHPDAWDIEFLLEADVGSVNIEAEWRE